MTDRHARPLPSGTITFLMTDIEGSTPLHNRYRDAMVATVMRHDALVDRVVGDSAGWLLKHRGEGDSCMAVFARSGDALRAACALMHALHDEPWDLPERPRVRIGVHAGEAERLGRDYIGIEVNRCARIRSKAHGDQILVSSTAAALARGALPPRVKLTPLGSVWLRGFDEPEAVYQLDCPGLPQAFPPLTPDAPSDGNVPSPETSFVDRDQEMAQLVDLVRDTRLVTVVGAPGCGKTRLAIEAALRLTPDFDGGVHWVDLAAVAEGDDVPAAVARSVRAESEPGRSDLDALCRYFRDRSALLLLDNCEHVAAGACAFVERLLRSAPGIRCLATSRTLLGARGEQRFAIEPLDVPPPSAREDDLAGSASVALLVQRARLQDRAFHVSPDNAAAVAEICRLADGLPLAIEIAASRLGTIDVASLAERLRRAIATVGRPHATDQRASSLAGAIALSHDRLSPPERAAFRRLSVFRGPFGLQAAESVASLGSEPEGGAWSTVISLADSSHLACEVAADGVTRYRMLEPLRQFAAERLREADEVNAAENTHAEVYVGVAESAARAIDSGRPQQGMASLTHEMSNLVVALDRSLRGGRTATALRLSLALYGYWVIAGRFAEGYDRLGQAIAAADPTTVPAEALRRAGSLAYHLGDLHAAERHFADSLRAATDADDADAVMKARANLGLVAQAEGDLAKAEAELEAALAAADRLGDEHSSGEVTYNLGLVAYGVGDLDRAFDRFRRSRAIYQQLGDTSAEAFALREMGSIRLDRGDLEGAEAYWQDALELAKAVGDTALQVECRRRLATAARLRGRLAVAQELLDGCRTGAEESRSAWVISEAAHEAGWLHLWRSDPERAKEEFGRALELRRGASLQLDVARSLCGLGWADAALRSYTSACERFREALAVAVRIGDRRGEADALAGISQCAQAVGDTATVASDLARSLELRAALGDRLAIAGSLDQIAAWLARTGDPALALGLLAASSRELAVLGACRSPDADRLASEAERLARRSVNPEAEASGALPTFGDLDGAVKAALAALR